jgi:hypothetical protein
MVAVQFFVDEILKHNYKSVVKDGHQNYISYDTIGLCAPNISSNLGSIVNTSGRAYISNEEEDLQFLPLNSGSEP